MQIKDKKLLGIISCVILGTAILIASLLFSNVDKDEIDGNNIIHFAEGWDVSIGNKQYSDVKVPTVIKDAPKGNTMIVENELPQDLDSHTYLFLRSSHQNVRVYIAGQPVYSFGWGEKRLFGRTPGCNWILIPLSKENDGANVKIELTGVYDRYTNWINGIYVGDKSAIINMIVNDRQGSILISGVMMLMGIFMLCITTILRNTSITVSLQRLGIFTILIGFWSICVVNIMQVVYGNVYFLLNLEILLFNLLFPVFLWFLLSFSYYKEKKEITILFWISVVQFFVIEILQITEIMDYMESMVITHAVQIFTIGYIFFMGIGSIVRKEASRKGKILVISLSPMLLLAAADVARFYRPDIIDEGFFTRIGTMIFIMLWAVEVIRNMSGKMVKMAKNDVLEILAYEDLMTGLKNRTAFEERMNEYQNTTDTAEHCIITFDMNCLKGINDKFGHQKGDQAIVKVTGIIKEIFEPHGVCYRIGGDEICVILPKTEKTSNRFIKEALQKVEDMTRKASQGLDMELSVAAGYAWASMEENRDVYQAFREADRRMYRHKKFMKGSPAEQRENAGATD